MSSWDDLLEKLALVFALVCLPVAVFCFVVGMVLLVRETFG